MSNKENVLESFRHNYKKCYLLLSKAKKISDIDFDNWNQIYLDTKEAFLSLLQSQRSMKEKEISLFEVGLTAYYLAWLEYRNYSMTSEIISLEESVRFYYLIRENGWFKKREWRCSNDIDKFAKYSTRFIWLSLVSKKRSLTLDLIQEFKAFLIQAKDPLLNEILEKYQIYINKIEEFNTKVNKVNVFGTNSDILSIDNRLDHLNLDLYSSKEAAQSLSLSEVVVVSHLKKQIQIEYKTPDMYRMIQLFEYNNSVLKKSQLKNPIKHFLFKPDLYQFKSCMSRSIQKLKDNDALLLYIGADPSYNKYTDGLNVSGDLEEIDNNLNWKIYSITPSLIEMYLRNPIMMIVDSRNSFSFNNLSSNFEMPFICFMSPRRIPESLNCILLFQCIKPTLRDVIKQI